MVGWAAGRETLGGPPSCLLPDFPPWLASSPRDSSALKGGGAGVGAWQRRRHLGSHQGLRGTLRRLYPVSPAGGPGLEGSEGPEVANGLNMWRKSLTKRKESVWFTNLSKPWTWEAKSNFSEGPLIANQMSTTDGVRPRKGPGRWADVTRWFAAEFGPHRPKGP